MEAPPTDVGDHRADMHNPTEAGTANDRNSNKRNIFPWEDLPAELRNRIYDLTLTTTTPIALRAVKKPDGEYAVQQQELHGAQPPGLVPNLLLVNKATYAEGAPLLYANNFYFIMPKPFFVFLSALSPTRMAWLRELTLRIQPPILCLHIGESFKRREQDLYLEPAFLALSAAAANLEHLHLDMSVSHDFEHARLANRFVREGFARAFWRYAASWLEALVRERGGAERAVELVDLRIVPRLLFWQGDPRWSPPDYACEAELAASKTRKLRSDLVRVLGGMLMGGE